ncbi:LysE family translocator [Conchiformibius steedae DSM 2580]|uniref:LysE family translocator n=1 Tax=Conchiformibius steedae DSM 2580 TaxID=1121352 RepID=A0AAE9HTN7_9NEIS|nr:LysE family translocator [Conchiformibius steedae]QMT32937.1 LysE family translocator [Conchiformibius steedae]URD67558.1 LysE family translocator [Conchiformibius steedae DSM 2580]
MSLESLVLYIWLAVFSYVIPGPDWLYIAGHTLHSRKAGWVAALGIQSGLLFHMLVGAAGATAVLLVSPQAFYALQLAGAGYLVYLGVHTLRGLKQSDNAPQMVRLAAAHYQTVYLKGLLVNVLNPKAAIFFISILPQFIHPKGNAALQLFLLGSVDIGVGLLWWLCFCVALDAINRKMNSPKFRWGLEAVSGISLLLFGLWMLLKGVLFFLQ